jgi:signal-transduction protein with cAMP-binding, CBS, and nucleotidyltransferase domain
MSAIRDDSVRSLITRPAVFVHLDDTLRALALTLTEESIGAAVVRGTDPLGLVSERDVVAALSDGADPDRTRVREIMTEDVAVAASTDIVYDVVGRMLDNEIRHIPVMEDGLVIGVISARDTLQRLADMWYPAGS